MTAAEKPKSSISPRNKWTFAGGCTGRDMNFVLISMFVLPYIQYTMNLSLSQFGAITVIMIVARIWDAVNDPMMGMLIENVQLKGGKFRPWILLGGVLNFFVTFFMFWIRPEGWAFVAFFGVIYIGWGMTFTINDIAYHSLLPNLARDNAARNELANLVQVFASVGQFIAGGLIPVLVTGNAVLMYRVIGMVIAFCFLLFTLMTYFGVRENPVERREKKKLNFAELFRIIRNNDQLIVAALSLLLYTIGSELFMSFAMNYVYFHFGYGGDYVMYFTFAFALGTIAALVCFSLLSKHLKRQQILRLAACTAIGGNLLFFLLGMVLPRFMPLLLLSAFFVFLGNCLFFVVLTIYIANTIEYNAVKTGERDDAVISSVRPFMSKLGAALQQVIYSLVLILSGVYTYSQQVAELERQKSAGLLDDITGAANEILANATEGMRLSIRAGMTFIPILLMLVSYIYVTKRYKITEEVFSEYTRILEERSQRQT